MDKLMQLIEKTADAFYQGKDKEGYDQLNLVIEKLLSSNDNNLNEKLIWAMNALEKKDTILLADILTYEIMQLIRE